MKSLLVLLVGVMLVGCSQSNYAKKKTTISNMSEFLKVNESVCSQFKSNDKKIYGCGTAISKILNYLNQKFVQRNIVVIVYLIL